MGLRFVASNLLHRLTGSAASGTILRRLDHIQAQLDNMEVNFSKLANDRTLIERLDYNQSQLDRLERMSHGGRATYVGSNRILTKCVIADAVIGFLLEADDVLLSPWLILSGMYETDVTNFFLKCLTPRSRCLDIGANFGFYTCLMARFCNKGKVVGVEPNPHVYELLRDNIYINGLQGVATSKHAAVSDSAGTIELHRRIKRSGNTSITKVPEKFLDILGEPPPESFIVSCKKIDDLLPEFDHRIDFIKIDVEGAEPLVMQGARQTISENPQLNIVMEWSPDQIKAAGFSINKFVDDLAAMGLNCSQIIHDKVEEIALRDLLTLGYRAGILLQPAK